MAITITRDLNVVSVGVLPVIHLSQYDSDFTLVFNLYASTGAFTMPTGTTAEIRGTKRDGNGYDAAASVSGNTVTVTGDVQMTAVAGQNMFEIATYYNNKRLNTINFILNVERAALDADTITSESVLRELDAIIAGAATATQAAEDAGDAADRAEEAARTLTIDPTLTQSGQAADAKATGDEITALKDDLTHVGLSEHVKTALLACFEKVAWIDEDGQDYYDTLEAALYEGEYPRITATFTPESHIVYTDDALSTLTPYLVVKLFEDASDTGTVISSNDYTLSGILTEGQSIIRVSYDNLATTFAVTAVDYYNRNIVTYPGDTTLLVLNNKQMNAKMVGSVEHFVLEDKSARAVLLSNRGKKQVLDSNETQTNYYFVPVPDGATKFTINLNPTTLYAYCSLAYVVTQDNSYYFHRWKGSGWMQNGGVYNIPSSNYELWLAVNFKADSAGTGNVNVSGVTVTFE